MSAEFDLNTVIWADELPPREKSGSGRLRSFTLAVKERPGQYARYPHEYSKGGVSTALSNARHSYPDLQWERRGNFLWARFDRESF